MRFDIPVPTHRRYRYLATSPAGFIQQLAVAYVQRNYFFYVAGVLPEDKDPRFFDNKMLNRYGVEVGRAMRCRMKKEGVAAIQYLRFARHWVLIATAGEHLFFRVEDFKDIRAAPIHFHGYSVTWKNGHAYVQIGQRRYSELRKECIDMALKRSPEQWRSWFWSLPFEPYSQVRTQCFALLRRVNERRKAAGLSPLPHELVRTRRKSVRVFE